jgi:hypothetical protein
MLKNDLAAKSHIESVFLRKGMNCFEHRFENPIAGVSSSLRLRTQGTTAANDSCIFGAILGVALGQEHYTANCTD